MKKSIHPVWHNDCLVTCACGKSFTVGSTKDEFRVEICSLCHPFFTGEMRFVDTLGRVERFQQKLTSAKAQASVLADKKKKKQQRIEEIRGQKSLKEMLSSLS